MPRLIVVFTTLWWQGICRIYVYKTITYTLGFKQAQNILILIKIYIKYAFYVIWRYVYLTLTFDLDKVTT